MEVPMSRLFMAILLALLLAPGVSVAQTPGSLMKGQRVRVVARCEAADCGEGDSQRIYTGQLEALNPDSLHIRTHAKNAEFVIPTATIARLYTVDGTRGHFWVGAGIGLLGGALIGGAIGSTTQFCIAECTPEDKATGVGVILGAPVGFLLGGIIGARIRSDRWRLVSIKDRRIGVAPRLDALGFIVDLRF
jgi:hypothetical protein